MTNLQTFVENKYGKTIQEASNEELYYALLELSKEASSAKPTNASKKKSLLHFCRVPYRKTLVQQPDQPRSL